MSVLLAVAGLVAVGAATPGPNNVLVFDSAFRHGVARTAPLIAGIVAGAATQVVLASAGVDLLAASPRVVDGIAAACALYLAWLGYTLVAGQPPGAGAPPGRAPGQHVRGAYLLQFVNPKGWLMAITAASAVQAARLPYGLAALLAVFVSVPLVALFAWALMGAASARVLSGARRKRQVDMAMGAVLIALAAQLAAGPARALFEAASS